MKTVLTQCKRIAVKAGSSLVTSQGEGLDTRAVPATRRTSSDVWAS